MIALVLFGCEAAAPAVTPDGTIADAALGDVSVGDVAVDAPMDAHAGPFADCAAIILACHAADPGTGPLHDCHELAHDAASNAECAPARAACVALCTGATGTDAAMSDAGAAHAHG